MLNIQAIRSCLPSSCKNLKNYFNVNSIIFNFRELLNSDEKLVVVGIIGKSNLLNCNKMLCFDLFKCHSMFLDEKGKERQEVRISRQEDYLKRF